MSKAAKKNPALVPLAILIGRWKTVGKHPLVPNVTLHGETSFEWLENGAFLIMRSHLDHPDFPDGIAIFGSDDSEAAYSMIYFDERGVSRKYMSTLRNNVRKWWRNDKEFSQRFTGEIKDNGNTIVSQGEMSKDGKSWEKDLGLIYTRISK
ncbi:MAG: hypothetical protein ABIQ93_17330 [Saprospiraceae bacterium]